MKEQVYDVLVIGAGPGGSTLAAFLAGKHGLKVALVEKEKFPRQRIGESLTHRAVTLIEESGALQAVLDSKCWVRKFGGYYAWDDEPAVSMFEHANWEKDGVHRWAIHVNRAEFDQILLEHARKLGVHVVEGVGVDAVRRVDGVSHVRLADGSTLLAKFVAEASGRQSSVVVDQKKSFLSAYKNVAIWTHVEFGIPAQRIDRPWNIFREKDLSSIGSFAFEDGWFWYIPVPMTVGGRRVETHSLGMVTDPLVLKETDYTDVRLLVEKAKQVPLLRELVQDAVAVYDKTLTATNYSMISPRLCDLDEGWMLIGDSAGFVDPLFSSGVTLSMAQANAAARVLSLTFDDRLSRQQKSELWLGYDSAWRGFLRSFAAAIDQWYHAIAQKNPNSVYWKRRSDFKSGDLRMHSFRSLVDTTVPPDVLQVLTKGTKDIRELGESGPIGLAMSAARETAPKRGDVFRLADDVRVVDSIDIDIGIFRNRVTPKFEGDDLVRSYWEDPVKVGQTLPPLYGEPRPSWRFVRQEDEPGLRFSDHSPEAVQIREALLGGGSVTWERIDGCDVRLRVLLSDMIAQGFLTRTVGA